MSMTREEAIASYERLYDYMVGDDDAVKPDYGEFIELNHYIRAAMRAPTREQVEKMRGEWIRGGFVFGEDEWECSKCHETEWRSTCSRLKFCPFCGAPMTDEAVDMMLRRWKEAVDDEENP